MIARFFRLQRPLIRITVYSKTDCHLCEEAKAVLNRAARIYNLSIEELDITTDERWTEKYGNDIPMIYINDKKAFKYRLSLEDLKRKLDNVETGTYS